MHLVLTFQDRALSAFAQKLGALASEGRAVLAAGLNAAMAEVHNATVDAETAQTGLRHDTLERAQHLTEASADGLAATIASEGGNVRLKFFGAKETPRGVLAHPFNRETVFSHAFMKGGRFPGRVTIAKLGGQVIERQGAARHPTRTVKSGVVIPVEMTKGRTAAAFDSGIGGVVAPMIVSKLGALAP